MRKLCCACFALAGMLIVSSESWGMRNDSNPALEVFQQLNEKNFVKQEVDDSNKKWITATKNWNQGDLIIDTEHGNPQHVGQLYIAYNGNKYWINAGQAYKNNALFSCEIRANGWSHLNINIEENKIEFDWFCHTLSVNGSNINVKCGIRSGNLHILGQNKFAQNTVICGTNMINIFGRVVATSDFKSISYHQYCLGFITDTNGKSTFVVDMDKFNKMYVKSTTWINDLIDKSGANGVVRQPAFFDMGHIFLSKDKKVKIEDLDFRSYGGSLTAESVAQEGAHQSFYVNNDAFDGEFHRFWHYYFYPTQESDIDIKHLTNGAVYVNGQQQQHQNSADFSEQSDFGEVRNSATGVIEDNADGRLLHRLYTELYQSKTDWLQNDINAKKIADCFGNTSGTLPKDKEIFLYNYCGQVCEIDIRMAQSVNQYDMFFIEDNGREYPVSLFMDDCLKIIKNCQIGPNGKQMATVSQWRHGPMISSSDDNDDSDSDSEDEDF